MYKFDQIFQWISSNGFIKIDFVSWPLYLDSLGEHTHLNMNPIKIHYIGLIFHCIDRKLFCGAIIYECLGKNCHDFYCIHDASDEHILYFERLVSIQISIEKYVFGAIVWKKSKI